MTFDAHYTSWRHKDGQAILLREAGPDELGHFGVEQATVDGHTWVLSTDKSETKAVLDDGRVFRAQGDISRTKDLQVDLAGKQLVLSNDSKSNWVVEDAAGEVVAQFSGGNNGVRRAILERTGSGDSDGLSLEEYAALSWFARLILESKLNRTALALIITLLAATLVGVLSFVV